MAHGAFDVACALRTLCGEASKTENLHVVHSPALIARAQAVCIVCLCLLLLESDTFYGLLTRGVVRVRSVEDGSQVDQGFPLPLPGSAPWVR